jgi:quercetin dioxygenase-like cupin family protein
LAQGVKKTFSVTTDVVKGIRVGVHKDPKPKVRVVLDLNPGHNYEVEQFFFEKENYYALRISSAE